MRIFLLGTGYVGSALLKEWNHHPYRLWVSTTTGVKLTGLQAQAEQAMLFQGHEKERLKSWLSDCDGMVITVAPKAGASYEATYLETAQSVVYALKGRSKPFYLLYTSSTSVYGPQSLDWIDETTTRLPSSDSAKVLCAAEDLYLACASRWITPCILRLGGIYGPGRGWTERARRLSAQEIAGSGFEPTNNIHLEDIVSALSFCFDKRLEGVYNLVNDDHRTRQELYGALCSQLQIPLPLWQPHLQSTHGSRSKITNHKIREQGFQFLHPIID